LPSKAHYDKVKMKYLSTLGMNKPPAISFPRERGKTAPMKYGDVTDQLSAADKEYIRKPISPARKRSVSTPINTITKGIPIPGVRTESSDDTIFQFDSDEDRSEEDRSEEDDYSLSNSKFIPPHEMLAKGGFEVGTARSLAVWESQRRKKMNDLSDNV